VDVDAGADAAATAFEPARWLLRVCVGSGMAGTLWSTHAGAAAPLDGVGGVMTGMGTGGCGGGGGDGGGGSGR
jgi:hypothetical protein